MVERPAVNRLVVGSNPTLGAKLHVASLLNPFFCKKMDFLVRFNFYSSANCRLEEKIKKELARSSLQPPSVPSDGSGKIQSCPFVMNVLLDLSSPPALPPAR